MTTEIARITQIWIYPVFTKPGVRCSIPDVDPSTGRQGQVLTPVLARYRSNPRLSGAISWGMNGYLQNPSEAN